MQDETKRGQLILLFRKSTIRLMNASQLLMSIFVLVLFAAPATAQDQTNTDPTSPSVEILQQEDTIRGLDRLKQLEQELKRVQDELTKLIRERAQLALRLEKKDQELSSVRDEVQQKQALKQAVPGFRLVALVQTDMLAIAVIKAGEKTYRVRDEQQMQLELTTGAKVMITCKIKAADTVELSIPELALTELVTFHPTVKD
ncbi:MAG: hypothetical protein AAF483_02015 [Planctomycetota bacterium]